MENDNRGNHGNHSKGSSHYRWNNKKILTKHHYVKIRVGPEHPLADPNGYAYEHLVVWISAGKELMGDDVLHHINGDRTDNRISNLSRMSRSQHNKLHNKNKERDELGRFKKVKAMKGR